MPAYLFVIAYLVDWAVGDPQWLPHPVRLMGSVIKTGEDFARKLISDRVGEFIAGILLTIVVVSVAFTSSHYLLRFAFLVNPLAGKVLLVYLAATTMATRNLIDEARSVRHSLQTNNLAEARIRVGRIVGRDTDQLDHLNIVRATIETLAESASDGIVAPMFYLAIGGVPAALAYKAVNTLDSMIGHNDSRYRFFGKFAARLDDAANFIPARLTAMLIVIASFSYRLNGVRAIRIWFRDARKHSSPNAGRPEAAMAGALGVRLGGLNYYGGEPHQGAYFGDDIKALDNESLKASMVIVVMVSLLMFLIVLARFAFIKF